MLTGPKKKKKKKNIGHRPLYQQFSSLLMFGRTIQHPADSVEGQMNLFMTHQPSKCNQGMYCLHFSNAADGLWKEEHAWLFHQR
jgi:hypothetical protein